MTPIESKRIALDRKIVLRFPDFDGFVVEYARNLSMTGMFIRTATPQPAGTPLSFELRLEDGAPLVRGSGWVVWAREVREGPDRPAGMGIEFTELDRRSRRLVRWLILSALPEGRTEFDVHAGTAAAPTTDRLATEAAVRRTRRVGLLTAAVLVALLGAVALLVTRSRETRGLPSVAAPRETPAAASPEQGTRLGPETPAFEKENREIRALVRSWAQAWSDQDVDTYLAHYSSEFVPEDGSTLADWRAVRRDRLESPSRIRVAVTRLEPRVVSDREARVTFLQTYQSDGYADTVDKALELVREDGRWKISRELAD